MNYSSIVSMFYKKCTTFFMKSKLTWHWSIKFQNIYLLSQNSPLTLFQLFYCLSIRVSNNFYTVFKKIKIYLLALLKFLQKCSLFLI